MAEENVLKVLSCVNANLVVSIQVAVLLVLEAQEELFVRVMELVTMVPVGMENALVKKDGRELVVAQNVPEELIIFVSDMELVMSPLPSVNVLTIVEVLDALNVLMDGREKVATFNVREVILSALGMEIVTIISEVMDHANVMMAMKELDVNVLPSLSILM